ncbi:hypothetical protein PR002_g10133 [Phytophthora rubi]|uniref:Uncharacterized protein n=1 Tax=Phytophthora rubi TaxID=129364 RepID=A0A6A3ML82_9STRA|nr:hypothetical protein PR002_g10133 [Phytophthora rubi]
MTEDMHETYFNATLTAGVPATVTLTQNVAHTTIFRELFQANTDKHTDHAMMRVFQRDVKRLKHDGQALNVVFYSRRAAERWKDKSLRLQKAVTVLRDTHRADAEEGTGHYTAAQMEIQYAIRVNYGALADSDSEEEGSDGMEVDEVDHSSDPSVNIDDDDIDDDAPYAYPEIQTQNAGHLGRGDGAPSNVPPTPAYGIMERNETERCAPEARYRVDQKDSAREPEPPHASSKKRATRRTKPEASGKDQQDGAIKGMQISLANYIQQAATKVCSHGRGPPTRRGGAEEAVTNGIIIPETPDSQADVIIGETKAGTKDGGGDLPIQLDQWLHSFRGREVAVTANRHCAFLIILAPR